MNREPWVKLEDGIALHDWGRSDEISYNQQLRQNEKNRFFQFAFDFLTDNRVVGDYWEFGCHRARTFRMALTEARKHSLDSMRFLAFDSFQGLPEGNDSSREDWQAGALCTTQEEFLAMIHKHGVYADNVELVPGFFEDSLKSYVPSVKPALVTVDCDFYASASQVLYFLEPYLLPGTQLYLDDYFCGHKGDPNRGVAKAFHKHETISKWTFVPHMAVGWWGRSFIVA
jgi:hypothetical protein